MIAGIHQPQYLPWLGYFDKINSSDKFVLLDNVQFKKNEWQNRNKIRTATGSQWLTVPVLQHFGQKINEVLINNEVNWRRKHLNALVTNYKKAEFFDKYISFFEEAYKEDWQKLSDINIYFIKHLVELLGIKTEVALASELNAAGEKTERLVNLCKGLGADEYLSGKDGPNYMDTGLFEKENIKILIQDFHHPVYSQWQAMPSGRRAGKEGSFESFMSVVDLLFNHGENSLDVICSITKERGH